MAVCVACSKHTDNVMLLQCDHRICILCAKEISFKTQNDERGLECPKCSEFSPKNSITQEVREFDLAIQDTGISTLDSDVWPGSLLTLTETKYVASKSIQLDFNCKGLNISLLFDELWIPCPEQNLILVYSLEGDFVRKQGFVGNLDNPRTVVQGTHNEFVFASANHGIAVVNKISNQLIYQLSCGNFAHLCFYKNILYCLEFELSEVKRYEYVEEKLVEKDVIKLTDYKLGHHNDTICVFQNRIYIGSWCGNCIQRYSMTGIKEKSYGVRGKGGGGHLFRPRIMGHDISGSLLICDAMNGRFQVLKPEIGEGTWYLTTLKRLKFPHFTVPCTSGQHVWILDDRETKLTLYVPETDKKV